MAKSADTKMIAGSYGSIGERKFDNEFMGTKVYRGLFEVVSCDLADMPAGKESAAPLGKTLHAIKKPIEKIADMVDAHYGMVAPHSAQGPLCSAACVQLNASLTNFLIHEIFGLTDWAKEMADELAGQGFIVIAPDLLSGHGPKGGGSNDFPDQDARVKGVSALDPDAEF